jgi:hypothetical protein
MFHDKIIKKRGQVAGGNNNKEERFRIENNKKLNDKHRSCTRKATWASSPQYQCHCGYIVSAISMSPLEVTL